MNRSILSAGIRVSFLALGGTLARAVIAVACALGSSAMGWAADAAPTAPQAAVPPFPQDHSEIAPDPAVVWGRLESGLRWCVMRNQQPKDKVTIRLQVENGSLAESEQQRGLAHYLEHMAFNGSTHFPPGKLVTLLQGLGLAFGAHTNAHTSFDETVYKLDLPDAQEGTLATGLRVMADWAGGLSLPSDAIDKERGIILAEMRDRNTPGFREFIALSKARYPGLIIGERAPIGLAETVKNADRELLKSYYDDWYRPEQMVLAVVGAIEPAQAIEAIKSAFADVAARSPKRERPSFGTLRAGVDVLCHHEAEDDGTEAIVELVRPRPRPHDSAQLRHLYLLQDLGERVFNRRITDLAERDPQGPILGGSLSSGQWLDLFIATASAHARPGKALEALRVLDTERRRLLAFGPTAAELQVAARTLGASLDQAVEQAGTRTNVALATGIYTAVHEDEVFVSPQTQRDLLRPFIATATPADVLAALKEEWLDEHAHLMVAVVGRDDLGADGLAAARAAFDQAEAAHLDPLEERKAVAWAYGQIADTGAVAKQALGAHEIHQLRFANHVVANIKHTDFQPNQVLVEVRLAVPPVERQPGLSDLVSMAFLDGGLGKHPTQELREILAGTSVLNHVGGPSFSEDGAAFSATVLPKDLELCLQELRAYIVDPGWRPEAEVRAKASWIEALESIDTDLDAQVSRGFAFAAVVNAPQRRPVAVDEAKAATFAAARRWFQPILESAPLSLSIVGDIDPAVAAGLAKQYLGSLGERREAPVMTDPHAPNVLANCPPIPADLRHLDVPGTNPRALLMLGWPTDDFYDIAQTRRLGMLAEAFSERLRVKVREELGQAYSPHAWREASEAYRGYGYLGVMVGVAPERIEDARAAVLAIAAELADKGIDDELLGRIKGPQVKNMAAYRQQNRYWLSSVLERCQEQPFRLDWAASMEDDYARITVDDVNALAKRYLDNSKVLQVIGVCAGPAKGDVPKLEKAEAPKDPAEQPKPKAPEQPKSP